MRVKDARKCDQDEKRKGVWCAWPGRVRHQNKMGHEANAWMKEGVFIIT